MANMTKKHFEYAAEIVANLESPYDRETATAVFIRLFYRYNDRFDEDRFRKACEPEAPMTKIGQNVQKANEHNAKVVGPRPIFTIAEEIKDNWPKVYFGAKPYLEAMLSIKSVDEMYGLDTARSIVLYFLANAQTWRGETARRIKAELKALVKGGK